MILFYLLLFLILWSYMLYPLFMLLLLKLGKERREKKIKNFTYPTVTLVITAHNEESVIKERIENALRLDYPVNKLQIIVASDFSTDKTNEIVESYKSKGVELYTAKQRKGKANAQNEVCETITTEIIAFSDANSMWKTDALKCLISNFEDAMVGYVSGKLQYVNTDANGTALSEGLYWKYELLLRKLESNLKSITAGNGAIYAIRRECYEPINILYSHDFELPSMVVAKGYNAIYNDLAIAQEKAGETSLDEYKRKVRMLGRTWHKILRNLNLFNPFKIGVMYMLFMLSHRLLRYASGLLQILLFLVNLTLLKNGILFQFLFLLQIVFYTLSILGYYFSKNKLLYICYYFNLFQIASLVGLYKAITNQVKPFWESPQTTRK